jgi:hypothetical protein
MKLFTNHPGCAEGAATPPLKGGEWETKRTKRND